LPNFDHKYLKALVILRRSCGISRSDHVQNDRIKEIMDLDKTIIDRVEEKQLVWYGHLQRMSEERWPKKIWEWTPQGRRRDEGPGPITSRRPWQPGTLMSKISRTVRGGEEVARNVRKGCRTLDEEEETELCSIYFTAVSTADCVAFNGAVTCEL
jgi:hypothetical protein